LTIKSRSPHLPISPSPHLNRSGESKNKSPNIKTFFRVGQKYIKKLNVVIRPMCLLGIIMVGKLQIASSKFSKIATPAKVELLS
ncbi:hypothetical protein CP500_015095, partial [Tychonema bourrellyi FEM_GT703]